MFTAREKRDEANRALSELRRRMTNRVYRGRKSPRSAERRIMIAEAILQDYENAIVVEAAREAAERFQQGEASQYLLQLETARRGRLWPAGGNSGDEGSD